MGNFFSKLDKDSRYILFCCYFIFMVNGVYSMIFGSILPLISTQYQLNDVVSGLLLSAHQAGNLLASFIAGVLPIYLGRKKSVISLTTFVIMGFLLMIFTKNPILLIIAFLFTGISRGSISNFNNYIVNDISNSSAAAINFLHSTFAIGALAGPFLAIFCVNTFGETGWKAVGVFIIFLVSIAIVLFTKMNIKEDVKKEESSDKDLSYGFLKIKSFWISTLILFFYLCAEASITGWIVKYFVDTNILTREYSQMLSSLLWTVILIGRLACAYLATKISKKTLLLITSIGMTIFYIILLLTVDKTIITLSIAFLGLFMSGIYPTAISNVGGTIKNYKMAVGALLTISSIGGIIMPIICGALSESFGISFGMGAIWVAIILMLIFVVISFFSKEEAV